VLSCVVAVAALSFASVPALGAQGMRFVPPPAGTELMTKPGIGKLAIYSKYGINPQYLRQVVPYRSIEPVGTIVINTETKFLYLVLPGGKAMRYGIGVARPGFQWAGTHAITAKRVWPTWTPPAEMLERQPNIPHFMQGGPDNPLGARALYIGSTLYRIHGTTEPWTIGTNVSSGCIRLTNDDVIDLYRRVRVGARVVVI